MKTRMWLPTIVSGMLVLPLSAEAQAAPAFATRATSDPSKGEATSTHSPVSTQSPSRRIFRSDVVVATIS